MNGVFRRRIIRDYYSQDTSINKIYFIGYFPGKFNISWGLIIRRAAFAKNYVNSVSEMATIV
jgi:hypothetical protein